MLLQSSAMKHKYGLSEERRTQRIDDTLRKTTISPRETISISINVKCNKSIHDRWSNRKDQEDSRFCVVSVVTFLILKIKYMCLKLTINCIFITNKIFLLE